MRLLWLCLLLLCEFSSAAPSLRKLKGKKKSKDDAVTKLKAAIKKLQEEKQTLSNEVMHNAQDAVQKAHHVSELTSQVSQKESEIRDLKAEIAKKNPSCAADLSAGDKTAKLVQEAARQQKEIANLTAQLAAMKIKHEILEQEFGDPSLRFFLAAKATKVYQDPGIQGAANKTFKYVLPHVSEALKTGTEVYSAMNASVLDGIHSLLGSETSVEPWLPLVSAFLVYGMICCPIGLALSYLVEFVCNVREVLLACSFYLVCVSFLAGGFVVATQRDPLKELAQNDPSVLLLQQFGFAGVLLFYMVMLTLATCWAVCDDKVAFNVILARLTQACFLIVFSSTYYRLVWTPTMLDEMPQVQEFFSKSTASIVPYGLAMTGFSGNLWLEWKAGSKTEVEDAKDA